MRKNRSGWGCRVAAALLILVACGPAFAQFHHRGRPQRAPASTSLTFMERDRSCVTGPIVKIEPTAVTVGQAQTPITIQRTDLLQASQGDALVFSARSSWADVEAVHLRPRESFLLRLRSGKTVEVRPLAVNGDGFEFKVGPWMKKRDAKGQVVTVDYLRLKPDSDVFDYFTQEAPALLFFYPESYDRLKGLEDRIPVRLYDGLMRQDDSILKCSTK